MPTLQRRQLVGHDILLARHGNHITAMHVDRRADRVVAVLDDGSTDSAPNHVYAGLPGTARSADRDDWKFFAVLTACAAVFAGVVAAAGVALAGISGDPALAELWANYPGS